MSAQLKKLLYTAEAVVEGGRQGHGRTSDGRLEVDLSIPVALGGDDGPGTNPEELFAVGFAACFQSALLGVARGRNLDTSGSRITSRLGIGPRDDGGFGLEVSLDSGPTSAARTRTTRGNIAVLLSVDGKPAR